MKLNNKVYDIIKWVVILLLPAIAVFYGNLGEIWNFPYVDEIVKTINAGTLFLGVITGISTMNYNKSNGGNE